MKKIKIKYGKVILQAKTLKRLEEEIGKKHYKLFGVLKFSKKKYFLEYLSMTYVNLFGLFFNLKVFIPIFCSFFSVSYQFS